jgi:hypothetical protein
MSESKKQALGMLAIAVACIAFLVVELGISYFAFASGTTTNIFKDEYQFTATGKSTVNESVTPGDSGYIHYVLFHTSSGTNTGTLTVKLNRSGTAYDTILKSQAMSNVTDVVYQPTAPIPFTSTDSIDAAMTNGDGVTWGLIIGWTEK